MLCLRGSLEETEVGLGMVGEALGPDADLVRVLGLSLSLLTSLVGADGRRRFRERLRGVVEWRISWRWSGFSVQTLPLPSGWASRTKHFFMLRL
jgi:hypothetical protein